jgi:hypothetical protein
MENTPEDEAALSQVLSQLRETSPEDVPLIDRISNMGWSM